MMQEFFESHFLFALNTELAITFFVVALFVLFFPPKKINNIYGYRTKQSRSSQAKWDAAQKYSVIQMMWGSIGMLLIGCIDVVLPEDDWMLRVVISMLSLAGFLGFLLYRTEHHLKTID